MSRSVCDKQRPKADSGMAGCLHDRQKTGKAYRIGFFNDLTNDSGHNFHCCQRVIEIRAAKSKDRAVQAAQRRFERLEQVQHWRLHATSIEISEITLD
jgi:hypothetical protein